MPTSQGQGDILQRIAAGERDFQGASLSGANLRGADLRGLNLKGANLRGASLSGADLRESRLMRTDLSMADVGQTNFGAADLSGADLRGANLKGANFSGAMLDGANLRGADLNGADLRLSKLVRVDLSRADLRAADISDADLRGVDLRGADLTAANFRSSSLMSAMLHGSDFSGADLSGANLRGATFADTRIAHALFHGSTVGGTVFADIDLRDVTGLDQVVHASPSTVGVDTLCRSQGKIPDVFLQGCGLTAWEILAAKGYDDSLSPAELQDLRLRTSETRRTTRPPRKRVLISYSVADATFVDELRQRFKDRGLFAWVAPHEAKGAVRERQSKLAIQHDVALLLVLSASSVQSDWVEHEMKLARKLEKANSDRVPYAASLDENWKAWQARSSEKLAEADVHSFADWQDAKALDERFAALIDAMGLYDPRPPRN